MKISRFTVLLSLVVLPSVSFAGPPAPKANVDAAVNVPAAQKCDHGVKKTLCTRCNPKLAAVFKAKGDWCGEHERPESQCALCHPDLAQKGVKK